MSVWKTPPQTEQARLSHSVPCHWKKKPVVHLHTRTHTHMHSHTLPVFRAGCHHMHWLHTREIETQKVKANALTLSLWRTSSKVIRKWFRMSAAYWLCVIKKATNPVVSTTLVYFMIYLLEQLELLIFDISIHKTQTSENLKWKTFYHELYNIYHVYYVIYFSMN